MVLSGKSLVLLALLLPIQSAWGYRVDDDDAAEEDGHHLKTEELFTHKTNSSIYHQGTAAGFWNRRRSTHEAKGCNSAVHIAGSELFLQCNEPFMASAANSRRRFTGACACAKGYQQGADGSGQHEICVPCGCVNLALVEGFSVDVCPSDYKDLPSEGGDHWVTSSANTIDRLANMKLPTLQGVKDQFLVYKKQFLESVAKLKTWLVDFTSTSIKNIQTTFGSVLLELREIRKAGLLEMVGDSKFVDHLWDFLVGTFTSVRSWIGNAAKKILDTAKAAWEFATNKATALKKVATDLSAALAAKIDHLHSAVSQVSTDFWSGVQTQWSDTVTWFSTVKDLLLNGTIGGQLIEDLGVRLMVTNPFSIGGTIGNVDVELVYEPTHKDGNDANAKALIDLFRLKVDTTLGMHAYGATEVHLNAFSEKVSASVGVADMVSYGAYNFLRDCSSGAFKFRLKVDDIALTFMSAELSHIVNTVKNWFVGKKGIVIPFPLPGLVSDRCTDAVEAIDYVWWQDTEEIKTGAEDDVTKERDHKSELLDQETDNEVLKLTGEVKDAEEQALLASRAAETEATKLTKTIEEECDKNLYCQARRAFLSGIDDFQAAVSGWYEEHQSDYMKREEEASLIVDKVKSAGVKVSAQSL